jgi:hypothetical protein
VILTLVPFSVAFALISMVVTPPASSLHFITVVFAGIPFPSTGTVGHWPFIVVISPQTVPPLLSPTGMT